MIYLDKSKEVKRIRKNLNEECTETTNLKRRFEIEPQTETKRQSRAEFYQILTREEVPRDVPSREETLESRD